MTLAEEKRRVSKEFDRVADTYDLLTSKNPGYARHLELSAARLRLGPSAQILDLCCGTGISTEAIANVYPDAVITALDASQGMLEVARNKPIAERVRFLSGDAMDPGATMGAEGPYDGILMAYGIRNMPDPDLCLSNLLELLAPGGAICFHEYSVRESLRSRALWNAVTFGLVIPGGLMTAGSTKIYRYLRRSVLDFDGVSAFEERLRRAGFEHVRTYPMDGWQRGILHSFVATRPR
jgi:ubiquinone/menaquinone biosynthesis C-methylase UbiE